MSSVILDFNALIFVMVSKRNLVVKRTGVSLMAETGEAGDAGARDDAEARDDDVGLRGAADAEDDDEDEDEGNKHLLYIDTDGRLNGTILQR